MQKHRLCWALALLLAVTACNIGEMDISGTFVLVEYENRMVLDGAEARVNFSELVEKFGFSVVSENKVLTVQVKTPSGITEEKQETIAGYSFIPFMISEDNKMLVIEQPGLNPPWFLAKSKTNKYKVALLVPGTNFYFEIAANAKGWEGFLVGPDEKSFVKFEKRELPQ